MPAVKSQPLRSDIDGNFTDLVSLKNLRTTWTKIRREAKGHRIRDAVDGLDWSVSIERTPPQLREQILSAQYDPSAPTRYEVAKGMGSYRVITAPNIRGALVYRLICDHALDLAAPRKVSGAFFSRRHDRTPVSDTLGAEGDAYLRFFDIWLRYQELAFGDAPFGYTHYRLDCPGIERPRVPLDDLSALAGQV